MANAWMLQPLAPISTTSSPAPTAGSPANCFTDYAGVGVQLACTGALNQSQIRFDLGADMQIDTIAIFGVSLIPAGSTVSIAYATAAQGYFTGAFSTDGTGKVFGGTSSQRSNTAVTLWSKAAPVTARYIAVTFTAPSAGQSILFSRVVAGKRIQLARNFVFGAGMGVKDLGKLDFSRRGVLLRARGAKLRTLAVSFDNVNRDEVTAAIRPLIEQIGNTEMIALVPDPSGTVLTDTPCYYGPLVGDDLSAVWRTAASWKWQANVISIF